MLKHQKKLRLIDARFYQYWQAFYLSLYSPRLYIDIAKRWKGFGFLYIFFLLSVVSIPLSLQYMQRFNQYAYTDFIEPFMHVPPMHIHQGRAIFHVKMPYTVQNDQGKVMILIDKNGSMRSFNTVYPDLIALITEQACYFRQPVSPFFIERQSFVSEQRIETLSFDKLPDGMFDLADWLKHSGLILLKNSMLVGIYPFIVSSFFGLIITLMLMLALVGQLTSYTIFRFRLGFKPACRLMAVASTFSIYAFFLIKTFGYKTSGMSIYCSLMAYVYFCFAVLVVRRESQHLVTV